MSWGIEHFDFHVFKKRQLMKKFTDFKKKYKREPLESELKKDKIFWNEVLKEFKSFESYKKECKNFEENVLV